VLIRHAGQRYAHYGEFDEFSAPVVRRDVTRLQVFFGIEIPYLGIEFRYYALADSIRLVGGGQDKKVIAAKTGLTVEYVHGILTLLRHGEERLLVAVQKGRIPLNAALDIVGAGDDDKAVQAALHDAYASGKLRGKHLLAARRVIEHRQTLGRSVARGTPRKRADVTASSLVRTYQREVDRQRLMVKKAEFSQQRLFFVVGALRQVLADENFTNLLRAEALNTLPKYLADRVAAGGIAA